MLSAEGRFHITFYYQATDGDMLSGMPTLDGLRRTLRRLDAHAQGSLKVFWTSLREVC